MILRQAYRTCQATSSNGITQLRSQWGHAASPPPRAPARQRPVAARRSEAESVEPANPADRAASRRKSDRSTDTTDWRAADAGRAARSIDDRAPVGSVDSICAVVRAGPSSAVSEVRSDRRSRETPHRGQAEPPRNDATDHGASPRHAHSRRLIPGDHDGPLSDLHRPGTPGAADRGGGRAPAPRSCCSRPPPGARAPNARRAPFARAQAPSSPRTGIYVCRRSSLV